MAEPVQNTTSPRNTLPSCSVNRSLSLEELRDVTGQLWQNLADQNGGIGSIKADALATNFTDSAPAAVYYVDPQDQYAGQTTSEYVFLGSTALRELLESIRDLLETSYRSKLGELQGEAATNYSQISGAHVQPLPAALAEFAQILFQTLSVMTAEHASGGHAPLQHTKNSDEKNKPEGTPTTKEQHTEANPDAPAQPAPQGTSESIAQQTRTQTRNALDGLIDAQKYVQQEYARLAGVMLPNFIAPEVAGVAGPQLANLPPEIANQLQFGFHQKLQEFYFTLGAEKQGLLRDAAGQLQLRAEFNRWLLTQGGNFQINVVAAREQYLRSLSPEKVVLVQRELAGVAAASGDEYLQQLTEQVVAPDATAAAALSNAQATNTLLNDAQQALREKVLSAGLTEADYEKISLRLGAELVNANGTEHLRNLSASEFAQVFGVNVSALTQDQLRELSTNIAVAGSAESYKQAAALGKSEIADVTNPNAAERFVGNTDVDIESLTPEEAAQYRKEHGLGLQPTEKKISGTQEVIAEVGLENALRATTITQAEQELLAQTDPVAASAVFNTQRRIKQEIIEQQIEAAARYAAGLNELERRNYLDSLETAGLRSQPTIHYSVIPLPSGTVGAEQDPSVTAVDTVEHNSVFSSIRARWEEMYPHQNGSVDGVDGGGAQERAGNLFNPQLRVHHRKGAAKQAAKKLLQGTEKAVDKLTNAALAIPVIGSILALIPEKYRKYALVAGLMSTVGVWASSGLAKLLSFVGGALGGIVGGPVGAALGAIGGTWLGGLFDGTISNFLKGAGDAIGNILNGVGNLVQGAGNFLGGIGQAGAQIGQQVGLALRGIGGPALAGVGGTGGVIFYTMLNSSIPGTFLPPILPTITDGEVSKYVTIKKQALPNSKFSSPETVQYSISISPKGSYEIRISALTDTFSFQGNSTERSAKGLTSAPTLPTSPVNFDALKTAKAPEGDVVVIKPGETVVLPIYSVTFDQNFQDSNVTNTVEATFQVSQNGELVSENGKTEITAKTAEVVCFGKCPQTENGCWPATGYVKQVAHQPGTTHEKVDAVDIANGDPVKVYNTFKGQVCKYGQMSGVPVVYAERPGGSFCSSSSNGSGVVCYPYGNHALGTYGGYALLFAHLQGFSNDLSGANGTCRSMSPGDVVGIMGSTGNSTGRHLHYEIRVPGGGFGGYTSAVDGGKSYGTSRSPLLETKLPQKLTTDLLKDGGAFVRSCYDYSQQ